MHYMNKEETKNPRSIEYHTENKSHYIDKVKQLMLNGDAFELIDGENLEFKEILIKEVVQRTSKDKVIVVAVIGP